MRWNSGVSFGYGVIKENDRGGLEKSHDFYFVHLNILIRYMLQTSYVDENYHFLTYLAKNSAKIPCFYDFLVKNWFLLIFTYIFDASKFPRAHSNVIWGSVILILVSMDRGGPYLYTGCKYRGIENPGRWVQQATTPPFGGRVTKNTLGGRGLNKYTTIESCLFYFLCCLGVTTLELEFWGFFFHHFLGEKNLFFFFFWETNVHNETNTCWSFETN